MKDESWEKAGRIPGLERRIDKGGVEARRFGALVSGYTVLYDASGKLLFEGGVTGSRGQVGANVGRNSVIGFLRDGKVDTSRTRVFGCYLFDRAERTDHPATSRTEPDADARSSIVRPAATSLGSRRSSRSTSGAASAPKRSSRRGCTTTTSGPTACSRC